MSAAILTAGKLVFAAMGIAVGVRLALMARERAALGLHTVALAAICAGGLGLLVMPIADAFDSRAGVIAAEVGVRTGMGLLCVFIAGTFRPTPIGWIAASCAGAFLVAAIVWDLGVQDPRGGYDYTQPSSHANQLSIAVPFLWATIESAVLWVRGRRRLQLGLASPAIVRSYLIWSVATACFVGICVLAIFAGLMEGAGAPELAGLAHAGRGFLYFGITAAIWAGLFRRSAEPHEASAAG